MTDDEIPETQEEREARWKKDYPGLVSPGLKHVPGGDVTFICGQPQRRSWLRKRLT